MRERETEREREREKEKMGEEEEEEREQGERDQPCGGIWQEECSHVDLRGRLYILIHN